ncbi:MAG: ABC transporter substrate-binding protein [Butyrivibrio sp.]|nr:ABC transporter substrate-binding protein [Butyrivibrio sp.]
MKKKILSVTMATAMTMSLLAGCGSSTTETTTTDAEPAAETATETPAAETAAETPAADTATDSAASGDAVNISVYRCTFNLANPDSDQVQKVEDAINAYIADKINVQIDLTDIGSGEYTDKANLALANNEINLLWTASWESTIGTNDLVPANAVYDITDILPGTDLYNSMDEGQWEATKYDGKNYFIPVYKDNVEGYDFMFRQDLIDKYGWDITSVKTLADLEPMLEDCKSEGLKYPYLTQKTAMFYRWYIDSFDFFTADSATNFFAVDRATNEVVDTIQTPEYLEFCKLMGEWADKGYISEDDYTKVTTDTTTQTQDWGISWWTDIPVNDEADARYGQDVTMQTATNRYAHSTSALGSCYCVTANSTAEQAQACIDFMGLLYTDSTLADMYTFGIEGEDYTYDANGQVEQTSEKYNHSMWESASATIVTPLSNEPANKADLYKDFNGGAETSCAAGFRFDKSPVEAQYTACANLFEQYGFPLENGGIPADKVESTIEEYQAALDAAGYQDVLAEFQSQYDAWKN